MKAIKLVLMPLLDKFSSAKPLNLPDTDLTLPSAASGPKQEQNGKYKAGYTAHGTTTIPTPGSNCTTASADTSRDWCAVRQQGGGGLSPVLGNIPDVRSPNSRKKRKGLQ